MKYGRIVTGVLAILVMAAFAAPGASAATPREIYADFADNGRLDGTYSRADLERALQDAEGQGYPGAGTAPAQAAIQDELGEQDEGVGAVGQGGGTLPFTGIDLALLTFGAVALLVLGWGFRRLGRART